MDTVDDRDVPKVEVPKGPSLARRHFSSRITPFQQSLSPVSSKEITAQVRYWPPQSYSHRCYLLQFDRTVFTALKKFLTSSRHYLQLLRQLTTRVLQSVNLRIAGGTINFEARCLRLKMEAHNTSFASPVANANLASPADAGTAGLLAGLYHGVNGWTAALTLLLILIAYDQCKYQTERRKLAFCWITDILLSQVHMAKRHSRWTAMEDSLHGPFPLVNLSEDG